MATVRRPKWHPPPPPTPRILHLPRRTTTRRKLPPTTKNAAVKSNSGVKTKGKLERLFDEERAFPYSFPPVVLLNSGERGRRERVKDDVEENDGGDVEERENEVKWRFQAEMLRAECKLLRMEREIALKKLGRERSLLQRSLKSALHILLSGKKKIREGKSVNSEIEEEIDELAKKLVELQRNYKVKYPELKKCSNFDKQALLLQKQLHKIGKMGDENIVKDIGSNHRSNRLADVEILRMKMEGLSRGKLLKTMEEEYGSMLSASANCSVPSSASASRHYDLPDLSSFSLRQSSQEAKSGELKTCSGHCKTIVRRIIEQVRAETEQWSQMQEMLLQVKGEMEEVQASRDFWEQQALQSEHKLQNLNSEGEEWKQRTLSLESKESQLQKQVQELQQGLENLSMEKRCHPEAETSRDIRTISLGAQLAKEKQQLTCHVKGSNPLGENGDRKVVDCGNGKKNGSRFVSSNRRPFKDIGNLPPLVRQNSRRYVYPLHSPQDS